LPSSFFSVNGGIPILFRFFFFFFFTLLVCLVTAGKGCSRVKNWKASKQHDK